MRGMFKGRVAAGWICIAALTAAVGWAQPGTLIDNVDLPVGGGGVSVAVDCQGVVYFTHGSDSNLYSMDKDGNLLDTVPVVNGAGAPVFIDEFSWDEGRQVLWGGEHSSTPTDIWQIDPTTGLATFKFTATESVSIGSFRDGLAYEGTNDTLWVSGDVSTTIEQFEADGTFLKQITPKNAAGANLGLISGVFAGVGDLLYLGRNGAVQIVQVEKSDGDFISDFASPGGARDEGLECDPVNYAPKTALWSREFSPAFMSVIEVEPGTCGCGGLPPEKQPEAPEIPAVSPWGLVALALLVGGTGLISILLRRS